MTKKNESVKIKEKGVKGEFMADKKGFKVVKDETEAVKAEEVKAITVDDIKAEIETITKKGTDLQKYIYSEKGKKEPFAVRRLRMEQFNTYCALIECLQAQLSVLEE